MMKEKLTKGLLVVVSGFSGAGKGTIINGLKKEYPNFKLSISATTRAPRGGEVDGESYFFITKEKFEEMIENDEFIEYADYVHQYYGTPKSYVFEELEKGNDVFLEIDMQGALMVRRKYPEAVMIFITAPSVAELARRLSSRDTETPEQIQARLFQAKCESMQMEYYDYIITNDNLDRAMEEVKSILITEHLRVSRRSDEIGKIQREFKTL